MSSTHNNNNNKRAFDKISQKLTISPCVDVLEIFFGIRGIAKIVFSYSTYGLKSMLNKYVNLTRLIDNGDEKSDEVKQAIIEKDNTEDYFTFIINVGFGTREYNGEIRDRFNCLLELVKRNENCPYSLKFLEDALLAKDDKEDKIDSEYVNGCECEDCRYMEWSDWTNHFTYPGCNCTPCCTCNYCGGEDNPTCYYDEHHSGCVCGNW